MVRPRSSHSSRRWFYLALTFGLPLSIFLVFAPTRSREASPQVAPSAHQPAPAASVASAQQIPPPATPRTKQGNPSGPNPGGAEQPLQSRLPTASGRPPSSLRASSVGEIVMPALPKGNPCFQKKHPACLELEKRLFLWKRPTKMHSMRAFGSRFSILAKDRIDLGIAFPCQIELSHLGLAILSDHLIAPVGPPR